jgi:hypothetical protein
LYRTFPYNFVLFIKEKKFFVGFTDIEDGDGIHTSAPRHPLRGINVMAYKILASNKNIIRQIFKLPLQAGQVTTVYSPVATVFSPLALINFSLIFSSLNNCKGANAAPFCKRASATIGRTSIR